MDGFGCLNNLIGITHFCELILMSSAVYASKRLDHLGLVAGFCREIDLTAIIDKALGTSERRQVCYG
jgi:hypothetical protein